MAGLDAAKLEAGAWLAPADGSAAAKVETGAWLAPPAGLAVSRIETGVWLAPVVEADGCCLHEPGLQPAIFIDIELAEGPLRIWSGTNNRRGGPAGENELYLGRLLIDFPALVQLANAKAHRTDIALFAQGSIKDLLDARALEVRGAAVTISFAVLKEGQPHPSVAFPLWQVGYLADTVTAGFAGGIASATISAATAFARRKRPVSAFWADADQQRRHPGDTTLERLPDMNEGRTRVFQGT